MKKISTALILLLFLPFLAEAKSANPSTALSQEDALANAYDELSQIDRLIKATQENVSRQQKLRSLIAEYRKTEEACIANPKNTDLLFQLAKTGKNTLDAIEESALSEYFRPEFLKELQRLAQIANKKTVPPVK